jgi:DNA polymerase
MYCGAQSTRWSGAGGKINLQNLPCDGILRRTLRAPPGHKLVVADFSSIEFRILLALAGEDEKLEALYAGRNLYCEFASKLYGQTMPKKDNKPEYMLGKVACLGLGYRMGKKKFFATCCNRGLKVSRERTDAAVDLFRQMYSKVVKFWDQCAGVIRYLAGENDYDFYVGGGLVIQFRRGSIVLPNGLKWHYKLKWYESDNRDGGSWVRYTRRETENFHEGVLVENICQSLARVCLSDLVCTVKDELNALPALLVHDEIVCVLHASQAEAFKSKALEFMSTAPAWWPKGPKMAGEGVVSSNYIKP